jgi:FAD/FMN-containing dehydrogenase
MAIDLVKHELDIAGRTYRPEDEGYEQARLAWNLSADQRPALVAIPESVEDVQAVVRHARATGLRVAVQGTGHNGTALGSLEGSVLMKMHAMRGVTVDAEARTVRAQAGALWDDVVPVAAEHGLYVLHGSSPDVGVVGYTLGGGIGWMARKHGMATNSVTAIELVDADGDLRRVDADDDPDLFWALRGGGGNFGAVVAMELRLFEEPEVYAGMMVWPAERTAEVLEVWRAFTREAPDTVTTSFRVFHFPPLPFIPEVFRGRSLAVVDGAFTGAQADGEALFAALRATGPEIDTFAPAGPEFLARLHMDPEEPVPGISEHLMLDELPDEAAATFAELASTPSPVLFYELRQLGGALAREAEGAGALASLPGQYAMFVGAMAVPELLDAITAGLEWIMRAMAPWDAGRRYLNFAESPGTDTRVAYPRDTYARLRQVRAAVDPGGLFQANHEIPAAA